MRIKWSLRVLLAGVFCIAVICAAQVRLSENVNNFLSEVETENKERIEALLSDANVGTDRKYYADLPMDFPKINIHRPTLVDVICFRRRCDIEFTTYEFTGTTEKSFAHLHDYAFSPFGIDLRGVSESFKMMIQN